MVTRLFLFIFLFLSVVAGAQKVQFITYGCSVTKQQKDTLQKIVKYEMEFYHSIFHVKKPPNVRIKIYGDLEKFKKILPLNMKNALGFYSPKTKDIALYKGPGFLGVCYHETSHLLLHSFCKNPPTWLDEGLACYFYPARLDSTGKVIIPQDTHVFRAVRHWFDYRSPGPAKYFRYSYSRFHRRWHESRSYEMSWAVVNYMMIRHRKLFCEMVGDICSGRKSEMVFRDKFPGEMPGLKKDLYRYYK